MRKSESDFRTKRIDFSNRHRKLMREAAFEANRVKYT